MKSLASVATAGLLASALSFGAAAPAKADDGGSILSEIRAGILVHDVMRSNSGKTAEANTVDVNGELLSSPLVLVRTDTPVIGPLLQPRLHLGFTANTAGWTDSIYGGATWEWGLGGGFFLDGTFGFAGHDGKLEVTRNAPAGSATRPALGSAVLFRESVAVGYRLPSGHSVSLDLSHMSNANWLASENDGLTFLGVRYGYKFN